MQPNLDELLKRVAEDTLASMTFLLPAEPGAEPPAPAAPARRASVDFVGPLVGRLDLSVPDSMVPVLAANMLGMDGEQPTPTQERDALAELVNVICGNLLPEAATPRDVFNVGAPHVTATDAPGPAPAAPKAASACLSFEEGSLRLDLYIAAAEPLQEAAAAGAGGRA